MKRRKKLSRLLRPGLLLMGLSGIISIYVFAASFETTFSRDLPLVNAVGTIHARPLQRLINAGNQTNQTDIGNYGTPSILKLPSHNSRIVLAPAIHRGNDLLARANTAHYILLSGQKNGNMGSLAVYFVSSWRTDAQVNQFSNGDNIFIDTDRDWRYFYRIDSVRQLEETDTYVARQAAASQLELIGKQPNGKLAVVEASLVNVQNVGQ